MSQPQNIAVQLFREHPGQSWGFRLQGGTDFSKPLSIQMVNTGGLAERNGLRGGDSILQINGENMECLEHEDAKRVILMCSDRMDVVVKRGDVGIWQPKVTPLSELRPSERQAMKDGEIMTQRTSLASTPLSSAYTNVGTSYNNKARPFSAFTPKSAANANQTDAQKELRGCEGYVSEPVETPPVQGVIRKVRAPTLLPPGEKQTGVYMTCSVCSTLIAGVFVKIQGNPIHPECFKCYTCGKNLKNQGHFNVEGLMYCEQHAAIRTAEVYNQ